MADLTIKTERQMGLLSVSLRRIGADWKPRPSFILSSARQQHTERDLAPGHYAIIAARPSGESLVQEVELENASQTVMLRTDATSPNEFLLGAVERGLVPSTSADAFDLTRAGPVISREALSRIGASGSAARTITGINSASARALGGATSRARSFELEMWVLAEGRWKKLPPPWLVPAAPLRPEAHVGPRHLQIDFRARPPGVFAAAVGVVDDHLYGPIVIVPLFGGGIDVSFLASGLSTEADERSLNPSSVRAPVAVAVPQNPGFADLLGGLNAGVLQGAQKMWRAQAENLGGVDFAFGALVDKMNDPVGATLAAHFLLRFERKRAPVDWLRRLSTLMPGVADPHVLLAEQLLLDDKSAKRNEIRKLVEEAAARPCHLFARSRPMLARQMRLFDMTPDEQAPSSFRYLDVAADAGGLDAFWGGNPEWPGHGGVDADKFRPYVHLDEDGVFKRA